MLPCVAVSQEVLHRAEGSVSTLPLHDGAPRRNHWALRLRLQEPTRLQGERGVERLLRGRDQRQRADFRGTLGSGARQGSDTWDPACGAEAWLAARITRWARAAAAQDAREFSHEEDAHNKFSSTVS